MIARQRHNIDARGVPYPGHVRMQAAVLSARPVGELRIVAAQRIGALALAQTYVGLPHHRRYEVGEFLGRSVDRADIAAGHQRYRVLVFISHAECSLCV